MPNEEMKIFCGTSHPKLGVEISKYLKMRLGEIELSRFSGGETYARIKENVRGRSVFVVQTGTENINNDLMELFVIIDALKRASAKSIAVVIPHFPYARQDKKAAPREPISARLVADLLMAVGIDRIITMDLHSGQIQGFFNVPVDHLTAVPLMADYFKKKKIKDPVVVAPDTGRAKVCKRFADRINAPLAILHKRRPAHSVAEIMHVVGDVKDRTVILFDDMVDTAGTATRGIRALLKHGARKEMYLAATHAIFSGPAPQRIRKAKFKEVIVTNSVPLSAKKKIKGLKILSVAPLLGEAIRRAYENQSISSLFD